MFWMMMRRSTGSIKTCQEVQNLEGDCTTWAENTFQCTQRSTPPPHPASSPSKAHKQALCGHSLETRTKSRSNSCAFSSTPSRGCRGKRRVLRVDFPNSTSAKHAGSYEKKGFRALNATPREIIDFICLQWIIRLSVVLRAWLKAWKSGVWNLIKLAPP